MKIGVVQMQSVHGDIDANITRHEQFIRLAVSHQVEMLVFPELSLTQYDAPYADKVATPPDDPRFATLQALADETSMIVCAGIPIKRAEGNVITMLVFQPKQELEIYEKHYLHEDELPFFVSGAVKTSFATIPSDIAFAVCYELSVPQHAEDAHQRGASVYVASVAKTHSGVENATERLTTISKDYGMSVLLSNCIGACDGSIGGGQSAVWNAEGDLLLQMDDKQEGFIVYDPDNPHIVPKIITLTTA